MILNKGIKQKLPLIFVLIIYKKYIFDKKIKRKWIYTKN